MSWMTHRGGFAAAMHSPDVKAALGAVGAQLRGRGWSVHDVAEIFAEAGFEVGDTTLRRWTSAVDGGRSVTSSKKRSGAQAKLDHEQREIATGWVLLSVRFKFVRRPPKQSTGRGALVVHCHALGRV